MPIGPTIGPDEWLKTAREELLARHVHEGDGISVDGDAKVTSGEARVEPPDDPWPLDVEKRIGPILEPGLVESVPVPAGPVVARYHFNRRRIQPRKRLEVDEVPGESLEVENLGGDVQASHRIVAKASKAFMKLLLLRDPPIRIISD